MEENVGETGGNGEQSACHEPVVNGSVLLERCMMFNCIFVILIAHNRVFLLHMLLLLC